MRVGFITQEYPPEIEGGAGTYAYKLVNELANRGNEIIVFTPQRSNKTNEYLGSAKIKIVPILIPDLPLSMLLFWLKISKSVQHEEKKAKFDVIHINGPMCWLPRKRLAHAPIVLTLHHLVGDSEVAELPRTKRGRMNLGGENGLVARLLEKYCVHNSDKIIAVSNFTKQRILTRYKQTSNGIVTIYEAPDSMPNNIMSRREEWSDKLELINKKILLFVGRINDSRKGLDLLLMALSKRSDFPDYVLIIVGKGDPEPIKKIAYDLGLLDKIKLMGFVESNDLWDLYNLCDLYIVPSRLEGFGLTVLDAAVAGKRVVATRVGAIPEIGGPGTVLVEPNNPIALANAIHLALSDIGPPSEVIREHAVRYSWLEAAQQTERIYIEVKAIFEEITKN